MQTDVYLQKALVEEVKKTLEGYTSINNEGVPMPFNVYPQNLPAKKTKEDRDHFPYVLVCLDEETIADIESDNLCSIYFIIGVEDANPNKQGHFDVANVMNKLCDRFLRLQLIDSRFRLHYPITKKFQEEDTWPKYIGGMSTIWELRTVEVEETEYD